MIILGIETSCDETSAAIIETKKDTIILKANIVASSLPLHAKTGGIIPEIAAREQLKYILPVLSQALKDAFNYTMSASPPPIDAIAVTSGPGLIGPLLIGVESARTLSYVWKKPVIPVNHMLGHVYANFIREEENQELPKFPAVTLVASGGHTDLIFFKEHRKYKLLGGTRDDAAGEALDKIGRLLGITYPAGAMIEVLAKEGRASRFKFPKPLSDLKTYDFSFSGLKTAVLREVRSLPELDSQTIKDISAGVQLSVIEVLLKKTIQAAIETNAKSIILSGGVVSNSTLREAFEKEILKQKITCKLFYPNKKLCTDNAGMIAAAAFFNFKTVDWKQLSANPELYYE